MRSLIVVAAVALATLASVPAANAAYFSFATDTSPRRFYDQHFDQVPLWAQKAFTPGNRR